MLARDIMTSPVICVLPQADIRKVATLMLEAGVSAIPVINEANEPIGIISEGDLVRHADVGIDDGVRRSWWLEMFTDSTEKARDYTRYHSRFANEVMTRDVVCVEEDASLPDIARILESRRIKRVVVVRGGKIAGIVSRANLLHGIAPLEISFVHHPGDAALRSTVIEKIRNAGFSPAGMNVTVKDAVVELWGALDSNEEREAIGVAVRNVPGVKGQRNHLHVTKEIPGYI